MTVYVVVEHANGKLKPCNFNVLAAASQLESEVVAVVIGDEIDAICEGIARHTVVSRVVKIAHPSFRHRLPERDSQAVLAVVPQHADSVVMAASSTFGKSLLPRVAALMGGSMTSDICMVIDPVTFKRPIYAGNALATVRVVSDRPRVITVRAASFNPLIQDKPTASLIEKLAVVSNNAQSEFIGEEQHAGERPELGSASIVVSGGRGLQTPAAFAQLVRIADRLGAAIGASRAAVDSGLAPNDYQVGQTGQVVAPKLYFAVGISGAIQHVAGIKDSKIIVAINKDPDAPIFQVADYGLVADLNDVLVEWEESLTKLGY